MFACTTNIIQIKTSYPIKANENKHKKIDYLLTAANGTINTFGMWYFISTLGHEEILCGNLY